MSTQSTLSILEKNKSKVRNRFNSFKGGKKTLVKSSEIKLSKTLESSTTPKEFRVI